jgi:hypothetical protein
MCTRNFSVEYVLPLCRRLASSPRTNTWSKHMLGVGRLASSGDPYIYVGGSASSWQGHQSQTSQRTGTRVSAVHWSPRLGVGRGANNSTPQKVSCYETSHTGYVRRLTFFKKCTATEEEMRLISLDISLGDKGHESADGFILERSRYVWFTGCVQYMPLRIWSLCQFSKLI